MPSVKQSNRKVSRRTPKSSKKSSKKTNRKFKKSVKNTRSRKTSGKKSIKSKKSGKAKGNNKRGKVWLVEKTTRSGKKSFHFSEVPPVKIARVPGTRYKTIDTLTRDRAVRSGTVMYKGKKNKLY